MARPFVGVLVAGSLMFSSTSAIAATSPAAPAPNSPWAALSAMSGAAPVAALCGAAAAAAVASQAPGAGCVLPAVDAAPPMAQTPPPQPIPVPPVEGASGIGFNPLFLALGALAAGALIYFLVKGKDKDNDEPNSPV